MSDRGRARAAYNKVMAELFKFDKVPTYALSRLALVNLTSSAEVFLMEEYRFIKYIGLNSNGLETYQVRT